jgi:hypothetical protein
MKNKATSQPSQTDGNRVDRRQDHEIDFSETPEMPPEKFAQAIIRKGLQPVQRKTQINVRDGAESVILSRRDSRR